MFLHENRFKIYHALHDEHRQRLGIVKTSFPSASIVFTPPSVPPLSGDRNGLHDV